MDSKKKPDLATFANQEGLPHLPVPALDTTVRRFIQWVAPLLTEEQLKKTQERGDAFLEPRGKGAVLQEALHAYAEREDVQNWLEGFWSRGYLANRLSLPLYSNIFYLLDTPEGPKGKVSQSSRAGEIIFKSLSLYLALKEERFPPETERGTPLCMSQYRKVFGASRIPQQGQDRLRNMVSTAGDPVINPLHIVVIHKGRFYRCSVLSRERQRASRESLEKAIETILNDSRPPLPTEESLGLFTTWDRDSWARARKMFYGLDERNQYLLTSLEEALFVVVLEHHTSSSLGDVAPLMLHGDGHSRWFDKTLQFIITPEGEGAINMEHSGTDGSVMSGLAAYLCGHGEDCSGLEEALEEVKVDEMVPVFSPELQSLLLRAGDDYGGLCEKTVVFPLIFEDFGKDAIKALKISPDSFIQMGLQLARYRTFGFFCTTYEPVMTRTFLHGRTEPIRTVSPECVKFVHLMDSGASSSEKAQALREAAKEHVQRALICKDGHGVDRHLYGLLQIYREQGENLGIKGMPEIFLSPGWQILSRNVLSTSTSSSKGLKLAGFGPVVEEGFGVRYLVFPGALHFCLSGRIHTEKELRKFAEELPKAFEDMRQVLAQNPLQS